MIKCIVCDLDGTLIKRDDTIEEQTYRALKGYIDNGVEFMIATGRDMNMVVDFLDLYDLDCDLILNNGTQYCNRDLSINEIYPMDNQSFQTIATLLNQYGYLLAIHTDQGKYSFISADDFWDYHMKLLTSVQYHKEPLPKKTFTIKEGYLRDFHYAKNAQEIINQGVKVLKIDARHLDVSSIQGIKEQLNIDDLDISSSYEENMEITTNTYNKGKLLEKIIKEKGYKIEEIAVFGDGENDCPMLEHFPYSFAPWNACSLAKNVATYTLKKTNEEGAVFEGLEILKSLNLL